MKNNKSVFLKGLLVSGVALGTIGLQTVTAQAATDTTTTTEKAAAKISNQIVFTSGGSEVGPSETTISGDKEGTTVDITKLIPSGYQVADGNNKIALQKDGSVLRIELTKAGNVSAQIHYIYNSGVIGTETLTGLAGSSVSVSKVPDGYYLANKNTGHVILGSGNSDVYLNVNKAISNNIVFVLDDTAKTEVGSTNVYGEKAGDKVSLKDDQIPSGYSLKSSDASTVTLQPEGNRQQITVTANSSKEDFKGTVATLNKVTPLYGEDGNSLNGRGLGANTDWATDTKLTTKGETFYRVSTSEFVKASDVYVYSANPTTVTAKDGGISSLYDINGKKLDSRAVNANSAWYSDRTTTINGQKFYRVSTSEWLSAADVK